MEKIAKSRVYILITLNHRMYETLTRRDRRRRHIFLQWIINLEDLYRYCFVRQRQPVVVVIPHPAQPVPLVANEVQVVGDNNQLVIFNNIHQE